MIILFRWMLAWLILRVVALIAYTSPRTWVADELVTATIMNTYIRDNQIALKSPPTDYDTYDEVTDLSGLSSTSFADIDATNWALTIVTTGGDVFVFAQFTAVIGTGTVALYLDLDIDGSPDAGNDGANRYSITTTANTFTYIRYVTGLSAGSHTFKLQYKVGASTMTIYRGAGTAGLDVHPQFVVREIS